MILKFSSWFAHLGTNSYGLVAYWGQNGGNTEKELIYYCTNSAYDTIVIGFVDRFAHPENKGKEYIARENAYQEIPIRNAYESRYQKCQDFHLMIEEVAA